MMFDPHKITTSVGYSFAIAALCSLTIAPQAALAEGESSDSTPAPSASSASSGKRVYDAPVASEKAETVYVFANPDGTARNTEVSTTLKNPLGENELADSSILTDISNAESDNGFTGSGDGMVWDAAGDDVYYTGATDKAAPVSVKISYFLDGQKITADKLAGASGKLKIRCDYANDASFKAKINGRDETLYVPFTFVTAMLFDNENFKNAKVTNGKLIDDGDRAIVAGYAIPGLSKSLGSIVKDFDIPDYFEVEADVTDFQMKTSLTIATAGLLEDLNTDDIDTSELEDASSELADAMDKILDGTGTLKDGLDKLADGAKSAKVASGKLAKGADGLSEGADALADGLETMKDSTSELPEGVKKLADGSSALADGLPEAVDGAEALANGAGTLGSGLELLKGGVKSAKEGATELATGADALANGLTSLKGGNESEGLQALKNGADALAQGLQTAGGGLSTLTDETRGLPAAKAGVEGVGSALSDIKNGVGGASQALTEGDTSVVNLANGASDNIDSALGLLEAHKSELGEDYAAIAQLLGASQQQAKGASSVASQVSSGLGDAASGLDQASGVLGQVGSGLDSAIEGVKGAEPLLENAASGAQQISDGLDVAIQGVDKLSSGTAQLEGGLTSLGSGLDGASAGLGDADTKDSLIYGANALESGATQLKGDAKQGTGLAGAADGAGKLADGLQALKEKVPTLIKGIGKVVKGADKVAAGSQKLAESLEEYDEGIGTLSKGTIAAAEGAGELQDGLQQFNDEGISEISDLIDDDLLPFTDRLDALTAAAKDYDNFAGITQGTKGNVKFIIETDPIE